MTGPPSRQLGSTVHHEETPSRLGVEKEEAVPASTLKSAVNTTENVSDAFDDLFNS